MDFPFLSSMDFFSFIYLNEHSFGLFKITTGPVFCCYVMLMTCPELFVMEPPDVSPFTKITKECVGSVTALRECFSCF